MCLLNSLHWIALTNIIVFHSLISHEKQRRRLSSNPSGGHKHPSAPHRQACSPQWIWLNDRRTSGSLWFNEHHTCSWMTHFQSQLIIFLSGLLKLYYFNDKSSWQRPINIGSEIWTLNLKRGNMQRLNE